jgi:MFS family permease
MTLIANLAGPAAGGAVNSSAVNCSTSSSEDDRAVPLLSFASALLHRPWTRPGFWSLRRSLEMITVGWVFGAVWLTATGGAPLTLMAKHLGATKFQFGLLSALPFLASLVSLPASLLIERTGERKRIFLWALYLQRLMWVLIALCPLYMVSRYGMVTAGRAMGLVMVLMLIMHAAGSAGGPAWVSWMAEVVPERVRGKFFSRRRQWGIVSSIPAALLVGWLMDRAVGGSCAGHGQSLLVLRCCAILFMCAAVFGLVDIHCFQHLPHAPKTPQKGGRLLKSLAEPVRDRRFMLFGAFVGVLTFTVSFVNPFATLYLIDKVKVDNTHIQIVLVVGPMLAQLLILPVWGRMADRVGRKPILILAASGMVPVGLGWCFLTSGNPWLGYVLSALGVAMWTGVDVANFNFVIDASGASRSGGGTGYVAVNSVIINVAGCLGGLASGLIAERLAGWSWQPWAGAKVLTFYDVLFALSGVMRLAALLVFLPFIHEPSARGTREALRFMGAMIFQGGQQLVLTIARAVKPPREPRWERKLKPV